MKKVIKKLDIEALFGIILFISAVTEFFSTLTNVISYDFYDWKDLLSAFFVAAAYIAVGITFLLKDKKNKKIVFAVGMLVAAMLQIYMTDFSVVGIMIALAYGAVGLITISGHKNVDISCIILLILFAVSVIYVCFRGITFGADKDFYPFLKLCGIFGPVELICILVYLRSFIEKKKGNVTDTITINADVIDFKSLLMFLENEYKAGQLSKGEYEVKRKEIISKI